MFLISRLSAQCCVHCSRKAATKKGESNFKILKHNSLLRPNSTSIRTSTCFEELLILTDYNNSIIAYKETNINIGSKCYNKIPKYIISAVNQSGLKKKMQFFS